MVIAGQRARANARQPCLAPVVIQLPRLLHGAFQEVIPREEWREFCLQFTQRYAGWDTTVTILDSALRQTTSAEVPDTDAARRPVTRAPLRRLHSIGSSESLGILLVAGSAPENLVRLFLPRLRRMHLENSPATSWAELRVETALGHRACIRVVRPAGVAGGFDIFR